MKIILYTSENMFNYSGRANRKEYWIFGLFNLLVIISYVLLVFGTDTLTSSANQYAQMLDADAIYYYSFLGIILLEILYFLTMISLAVRRLHDINFRGWWLLITLIPFLSIFIFILTFFKGTKGPNRFGEEPN